MSSTYFHIKGNKIAHYLPTKKKEPTTTKLAMADSHQKKGINLPAVTACGLVSTKVFYEISEKLYKQAGVNPNDVEGATAEATDEGEAKEGTVYDADYKVDDETEDDK